MPDLQMLDCVATVAPLYMQVRWAGTMRAGTSLRYLFRSVSKESSRREMSELSSYAADLPPSDIRNYSLRMESSLA